MSAQIVLVTPENTDVAQLREVLAAAPVSALIVRRRNLAENAYKALVKALAPAAQATDCAVLIEGEPGLVRLLGADGLHIDGDVAEVRDALAKLKPELIVGTTAGDRDDAMTRGELGVDYVYFSDPPLAGWWAETMEVPAVLDLPTAAADELDPEGCEFVALSDSLWNAKQGPVEAIRAFAGRLEQF